tara:strand:- start:519 stop:1178 length:660 start_codon:yes stop_codon:yes gene_type:complete
MATFWSNAALEPKRQFRFLLQLSPIESYVITKVNRPSFDVGEAEHKFINHTFYYPGRVTWQDVTFTLVDSVMPDTTGILMKMLMASGYRFPNNQDQAQRTISKVEAVSAVGSCLIHVLGHGDTSATVDGAATSSEILETWTLKNPWIKSVNMGDLDYGSDDILSMDVTLKYDWATLSIPTATFAIDSNTNEPGIDSAARLVPKSSYDKVLAVPDDLISN